jgi:hypothetical protein
VPPSLGRPGQRSDRRFALAALLAVVASGGCQHTTVIGALAPCAADTDCAPPGTICGADDRCVLGCAGRPNACVAGATCNAATGECEGGVNQPCTDDADCDWPVFVCKRATMLCVAGCDLDPSTCYGGWICNFSTGRCCDPDAPDCRGAPDGGAGCNSDDDCASRPGTVCLVGACVPDCTQSGCDPPLSCTTSGHCGPPGGGCARDSDCDAGSYCAPTGACVVLASGGPVACAGGTVVRDDCDPLRTAAGWRSCVGAPGPPSCPYCSEGSCYHPRLCDGDADCHLGDTCTGGLCQAAAPQCPVVVAAQSVVAGGFAAGREVCVHDTVADGSTSYDGSAVLHLGASRLTAILPPLYLAAGLATPPVSDTITLHGVVRWDQWRTHWELYPVDWWQ